MKEKNRTGGRPKIGIIGCGMVGDVHIEGIKRDGRADVTWIATATEESLKEKSKKHGIYRCTLDYRDILSDPDLDAVVICTPPYLHLEMTLAALEAGKDVLVEKPVVASPEEIPILREALHRYYKAGRVIMEPSFRHGRLNPKYHFIKSMIEGGVLGHIYHIHHNQLLRRAYIDYNPRALWSLDKKKSGGGPLINWGVYDLSFHLGLLDDKPRLESIRSFTRNGLKRYQGERATEVEEHGAALMEFSDNLTCYLERGAGVQAEIENETRIFGTKGYLRFGYCFWQSNEIEHCYMDDDGTQKQDNIKIDMTGYDHDNWALSRHFVDCLLGQAQPLVPVNIGLKNLEILFRIVGES